MYLLLQGHSENVDKVYYTHILETGVLDVEEQTHRNVWTIQEDNLRAHTACHAPDRITSNDLEVFE